MGSACSCACACCSGAGRAGDALDPAFYDFGFLVDRRDGASPPTIYSVVYVYVVSLQGW